MDKKGEILESIRKDNDNNIGDAVSVDQLQSSHPGLVPQFQAKPQAQKFDPSKS